ncbi:glutamate dehydrogenase [Pelomyxa schiedti]|nr:glutamate dehydrogenase [Pelomyxa schiedti]
MEKNDTAVLAWLNAHMAKFVADATAEESTVVAHTLVYSEEFEEFVYLNFKNTSLVISLAREHADTEILRHYGETSIKEYFSYVSDVNMPGYDLPLRMTRVSFLAAPDAADRVMPAAIKTLLCTEALVRDSVQHKLVPGTGNNGILYFAWRNVAKRMFLFKLAQMFKRHSVTISNLHFTYVDPLSVKCVLLGAIGLVGDIVTDDTKLKAFMREFEILKGLKVDILTELVLSGTFTGSHANLLRAFAGFIEQILSDVNAAVYTEEMCLEAFAFHPELTLKLLSVFAAKFHPATANLEEYARLKAELEKALSELDTGRKKHDDRRRNIFLQALNITEHCLRTNAYNYHKLAIGFRLNPEYMNNVPGFERKSKYPELPFSVFYIKGWNFTSFQVRFRDLARGGMRTVVARDQEHARFERSNMFTECYNLAYTQQKKNKDIPEGGSKAIVFVAPNEELSFETEIVRRELEASGTPADKIKPMLDEWVKAQTLEYMYYNQRCFLNTFLCLFIWDFAKNALKYGEYIVDYLKVPEYIYLGPDENMHDSMIHWLAGESIRLGYYSGGAFISGKDDVGINHKEYGVTSWGMYQYLIHTLRYLGLEGKPFTCKITGGPDGDVAGNMIRLLAQHLPTFAKLLVVTDASGTMYDPEGMNLPALVEMFHKVKPIAEYPRELLHEGGFLLCLWQTRQRSSFQKETLLVKKEGGKVVEEWITGNQAQQIFRLNAHQKYADVFIPSGGRPRALNMLNMKDFFDEHDKPTTKAIVEGANLYIPQDAREFLEDKGVLIYKDSSANKCGVVSSSYEILAGLSLKDAEFVAIKPALVQNVLARLAKIANDEAAAMMAYWLKNNKTVKMTHISELVSQRINKFTDDVAAYLKPLNLEAPENRKILQVFIDYVPDCIKNGHLEQCLARVPDMHKKAIISTALACKLVYGKGIDWEPSVVDILPLIL